MENNSVLNSMLEEFDGCEGGDPGSPESPSIWLFGIEPGWSRLEQKHDGVVQNADKEGYTIDLQRKWPFNRNAFKLFTAMNGRQVSQYIDYAVEHQPFVVGRSQGYFKGNLYPYACNNVGVWPDDAARETGFTSKAEYKDWCKKHRFHSIYGWVNKYRPKLFIGVGSTFSNDFSSAVYGRHIELDKYEFEVNGALKKIYFACSDGKKLVVIPHLSRGLHENVSLQTAGEFIAKFIAQ